MKVTQTTTTTTTAKPTTAARKRKRIHRQLLRLLVRKLVEYHFLSQWGRKNLWLRIPAKKLVQGLGRIRMPVKEEGAEAVQAEGNVIVTPLAAHQRDEGVNTPLRDIAYPPGVIMETNFPIA